MSNFVPPSPVPQRSQTAKTVGQQSPPPLEAYFHAIIRQSSDIIVVVDKDGAVQHLGAAGERILGYSLQELLGRGFLTLVHPDDLAHVRPRLIKLQPETGFAAHAEFRVRHKDGRWLDLEAFIQNLLGDPSVAGIVIHARDISRRKQAEEELHRSEERFRTVAGCAHDLIYEWDVATNRLEWFGDIDDLLGFSPGEAPRDLHGFRQLIHPDDQAGVYQAIEKHLRTGVPYHQEYRVRSRGGDYLNIASTGTMVRDRNGAPYKWIGAMSNVTDRKQAEEMLQRERDQAQMYLDMAGVALIALDRSGDIILANKKCCQLAGEPEKDLLGQPWFDRFVPPDVRDQVKKVFGQLMEGRMDNYVELFENDIITSSGKRRTVNWHNTLMRDAQGRIIGSFSSGEDVTEQRKAERKLADEQAEIRRLLEFQELVLNTMGSGVLVADIFGEVILANPQARRILGFGDRELVGMMIGQISPGMEVMLDRDDSVEEAGLRLPDGRRIDLGFNRSPILDEDGDRVGDVVIFQDITEFKRAREALRESEARVQRKLAALISPEEDLGELELEDIIDVPAIQRLMDKFYELTQVPVAVIDLNGKVLVGTGWQDVCTRFHRAHPETLRNCIECDTLLTRDISPGAFKTYICRNGLRDCATPLIVGGRHVGNLFTGQFFFREDKPDEDFFRAQATRYGFDEEAYLKALRKVPVWDRRTIDTAFEFYTRLANMISELSHRNIVLARLLEERRRAEEELRHSLQTSADIISSIPSGFFTYQFEPPDRLVLIGANPEAERLTGVSLSRWAGREFNEIWPEARRLDVTEKFLGVMRTGVTFETEDLFYQDNRLSGAFRIRVFALPDQRLAVAFENITDRKQAEEKLREREETYRALVEGIPDIVLRFDRDGRHVFASGNVVEFFNLPASEYSGKTHRELGFPDSRCRFWEEAIRQVFDEGQPQERELSFQGPKGLSIINWRLVPELDSKGSPRSVLAIGHDVTEKKRVEAEKEELQKRIAHTQKLQAIGTLAGGIAHDFNNILGVIIGNSELLLHEDHFSGEDSRTDMRLIMEAGQRGQRLVRQILAFSRQEQAEKQAVDINLIVKETVKMLRSLIPSSIKLKWSLPDTPSRVLADATQVQQVLINLAANAADAVGDHGEIVLELAREIVDSEINLIPASIKTGEYLRVKVQDNGPGIPATMIERVFEPFFTTKPPGKGTGLGLAVVHGIVTSHGGAIGVESIPGRGTTFNVYFPALAGDSSIADAEAPSPSGRFSGRILLVDDDESIIRTMERILTRLGFEITSFSSSSEALNSFRESPSAFTLVISDVVMPNLTGDKLAREIISIRNDIPIILYSGSSPPELLPWLQERGRVSFLSKPIGIRELYLALSDPSRSGSASFFWPSLI